MHWWHVQIHQSLRLPISLNVTTRNALIFDDINPLLTLTSEQPFVNMILLLIILIIFAQLIFQLAGLSVFWHPFGLLRPGWFVEWHLHGDLSHMR